MQLRGSSRRGSGGARACPLDRVFSALTSRGLFSCSRRLLSAYRGPAIRVRRASDNAETDLYIIGPGAGWLDVATLASFCAGTNGFVSKWYSQDGVSSRDATAESGNGNQAKIFDSATGVLTQGGIPAATFDGSDDRYTWTPGYTVATSQDMTFAAVLKVASLAATNCFMGVGYLGNSGAVFDVIPVSATTVQMAYGGTSNRIFTVADCTTALRRYVWSKPLNSNISAVTMRQDYAASSQASQTGSQTLSLNTNTGTFGGKHNSGGSFVFPFNGSANLWLAVQDTLTADQVQALEDCLAQHI